MVSKSKSLRDAMKARFYPFAAERGFTRLKATSLEVPFVRDFDGQTQRFEIQWDKYHRPYFRLNFGRQTVRLSRDHDPDTDPRIGVVEMAAGSLQRRRGPSLSAWFRLSKPWIEMLTTMKRSYTPDEVVTQVISGFEEIEDWWATRRVGPHIDITLWPDAVVSAG